MVKYTLVGNSIIGHCCIMEFRWWAEMVVRITGGLDFVHRPVFKKLEDTTFEKTGSVSALRWGGITGWLYYLHKKIMKVIHNVHSSSSSTKQPYWGTAYLRKFCQNCVECDHPIFTSFDFVRILFLHIMIVNLALNPQTGGPDVFIYVPPW
jgi:hypothetical protein